MIVAKLSIRYDRGIAYNTRDELEVSVSRGSELKDGSVLRGLGTHFKNREVQALVLERDRNAKEIYRKFRGRFLATPVDGLYAIPKKGDAKTFLIWLSKEGFVRGDVNPSVTEFELTTTGDLNAAELTEWSDRIKRQLNGIQLGRKSEPDEEGLKALETLASCPLLGRETANGIRELVNDLRTNKINRVELKRSLDILPVVIKLKAVNGGKTEPQDEPEFQPRRVGPDLVREARP